MFRVLRYASLRFQYREIRRWTALKDDKLKHSMLMLL